MAAEYACGQILFSLKQSNLHYLINETHKSAYITIRKKFINDTLPNNIGVVTTNSVDNKSGLDEKVKMENGRLKQEINDLKIIVANMEVEKDEVEVKNEKLNERLQSLEDTLENAYKESRELTNTMKGVKSDLKLQNNKVNNLEKVISDLENVIESRDQKIYDTEVEMKKMEETIPFTFPPLVCDKCKNI